ncbi:MAG TPA: aldolase/citrate lyase family protein [Solirubrobacterales bacterium]|nr:aldolase/citrate lyase family protein [Solirubrobacterales bacterium]
MKELELTGFRKRLREPGPLFFSIAVVPEPVTASILGHSGVDYVMLDAEHAPFTLASLHACVTALKLTPTSVIVRTSSADPVQMAQMADLGVDGVLAPHIETAEEAAAVVRAIRFPPEGGRGIGEGMLSTRYGLDEDVFVSRANAGIAAMVILESKRGIENAAEIAAVPGIDAIFVGSADLSGDLGVPGEYRHPEVLAGVDVAVEQAVAAGLKVFGLSAPRTDAERNAGLVCCATDAIALTAAAAAGLEQARASWNGRAEQ